MENCIICDLDGTLCLFDGNPYDRDFSKDIVNEPIRKILTSYLTNSYDNLVFLSGRNDKFESVTREWLNKYFLNYELYMRKDKDFRKDVIVKEELYNNHVKNKYNVSFVIDDRLQVCRLWYYLGLFVLNVNQGLIEF